MTPHRLDRLADGVDHQFRLFALCGYSVTSVVLPRLAEGRSPSVSQAGTLAFSEMLTDPDYPRAGTLIRLATAANFQLKKKIGNFFAYTLVFEKQAATV